MVEATAACMLARSQMASTATFFRIRLQASLRLGGSHRPNAGRQRAGKVQVLLAIFEHPPEASGETINSAVVIAAERPSPTLGIKTAAEYFGSLTELATSKGFQAEDEPHESAVGTKRWCAVTSSARGTLTMRQTSLVMLRRVTPSRSRSSAAAKTK